MASELDLDKLKFLGDLQAGRPTLGTSMSVPFYRLNFYSLKAVLEAKYGKKEADEVIYATGKLAGKTLFQNLLKDMTELAKFINKISEIFLKNKIGRFAVKDMDLKNKIFSFYITEDIDCSGLPTNGETRCIFDAGLISGLLSAYYKTGFATKEIGCWGTGEKFCLFKSTPVS